MDFLTTLGEHLWAARTPFAVIAYFVAQAIVSRTTVERYHMRGAATLIILHVLATVVAAAQD
nr:hypothetical protein [Deltaproteobacteria bacterium]